jgi:hypothetical protein
MDEGGQSVKGWLPCPRFRHKSLVTGCSRCRTIRLLSSTYDSEESDREGRERAGYRRVVGGR